MKPIGVAGGEWDGLGVGVELELEWGRGAW